LSNQPKPSLSPYQELLAEVERRRDAAKVLPTTPEPGSELQQKPSVKLTIIKRSITPEPGSEHGGIGELQPGNLEGSSGAALGRFKVRPMVMAQDAHTNAEQRLYLALWSRGTPRDDISRTITMGILSIAKLARMGETMCRQNLRSLIRKLAVEECGGYDCAAAVGKTYRIFNYAEILRRRREWGFTHYVRKTSAVVFVDPVTGQPATPRQPQAPLYTAIATEPDNASPEPGSELAFRSPEPGSGLGPSSEPPPGSELGGGLLIERIKRKEESSSSAFVVTSAIRKFAPNADDDGVTLLIANCRTIAPDATLDEIAYFVRVKAEQGINSRRVRSLMGFLLKAVPRCFAGTMLEDYRAAIRQERERERSSWLAILNDPNETEDAKQMARDALVRLDEETTSSR